MQPLVVGRNEANDEVLVELRDQTTAAYALVELTWNDEQVDDDQLPATLFFASAEEASGHMARDAADHNS
jgi:hypothetical protein